MRSSALVVMLVVGAEEVDAMAEGECEDEG